MDALHFVPYSEIMDAGRVRTVLECGNSFKPTCAIWRTKIPYAFAVGEPATMSRPLKLKVQEPRGLTVFQLPDHGFARAVCGGAPQMFPLNPVKETDSMCPASSPEPLCLPRFGFVTTSDAVFRHLALSFSRFANRFPLGHPRPYGLP